MFRSIHFKWMGAAVLALTVASCSVDTPTEVSNVDDTSPVVRNGEVIPGQYIVVFNDHAIAQKGEDLQSLTAASRFRLVSEAAERMVSRQGIAAASVKTVWETAIHGALMRLTDAEVAKLRQDPSVRYIEQDRWVTLPPFTVLQQDDLDATAKPGSGGTTQPVETTPWGITQVGGAGSVASTVTAWIIDSGIDLDHPDLNVDVSRSKTWVSGYSSPNDQNGHGSHVSGTVGAIDNTIGVIGVAPGIKLVALQVLDRRGSGQFSWSISAFNHVANNGQAGDVVNYSVGPGSRYTLQTLDDAVANVGSKGIKVAMAAGNANDDCTYYSPARVNADNVYTIASMTSGIAKSSFSNYGSPVDAWEPGSSIYSTYKDGKYATLSGTSMASPHGCGILALGDIVSGGTVSGVPAGTTTTWGKHN